MQTKDLFNWYEGKLFGITEEITAICDNSEQVTAGCVFVCIEGKHHDGHDFARDVLKNGAALVVVQRDLGLEKQIIVQNTKAALALLWAAWFGNPANRLKIIGITGTNGKTSTAFLLRDVLERAGEKVGLISTVKIETGGKTQEASLTTPKPEKLHSLFKEMADNACTYCVMEVSSQALEQQRTAGIFFAAAVFTNITQEHLDYHGTMECYKSAKRLLFPSAGLCVINIDDEESDYFAEACLHKTVTYSITKDAADYVAKNIVQSLDGAKFHAVTTGSIARLKLQTPGRFSIHNALAALATATQLGFDFEESAAALSDCVGIPGRLERVKTDTPYRVYIDYAHTPDALENVLLTLRECTPERIIAVFGCGGDRDSGKRPIMGKIAALHADIIYITSDNPRTEDPEKIIEQIADGIPRKSRAKIHKETDRKTAIGLALKIAQEGDIVILAGKGHEDYQILSQGKIELDERAVVHEFLDAMP
ncbi:MAG: UDP-N-acetylmuramoyl-L-alanyl-D-glutamate--2,6-diaminopimelate ligase [Oscillospiraceae bacterium]|nr:UDP-N-acetylmuramoyl-L-alanyl-D-glutamate--2,6-diaminopimelate ligase [Oscillospiraceae bacterium]